MTGSVKNSFLDFGRSERLLEKSRSDLLKTLRHWQLWEAEYEGLKEMILAAPSTPSRIELATICSQYDGELVSKKEVNNILGLTTPRDAVQVINVVDRRIDYVEQNIRTLQNQIEGVEEKLASLNEINTLSTSDEDALPFTEIIEELDENDNIISSHTSTPAAATPQHLEVLRKSGVNDRPLSEESETKSACIGKYSDTLKKPVAPATSDSRRSVSFAEDTKPGPDLQKSDTAKRLENIMKIARQQEEFQSEPPIIPDDESAQDASLRREMLQYGMSEIGAVVAELDLEEDDSNWSVDDYDGDEAISDSDEEDEYGRYTGQVINDELRKRMMELEKRLGSKVMENIGKKASDYDVVEEGIGRITINEKNKESPVGEKSVRFSERLDIAPDHVPLVTTETETIRNTRAYPTVNTDVEKNPLVNYSNSAYLQKGSISKMIKATNFRPNIDTTRTVPEGPPGIPLAETITERNPINTSAVEPDEMDPHLLQQEVATEYHKMRNMMIQRQGGFMKENESVRVEFTEEEGGPKKISRFKAARLARS